MKISNFKKGRIQKFSRLSEPDYLCCSEMGLKLAAGRFSQCPLPREAVRLVGSGQPGEGGRVHLETPSHQDGREARPALCATSLRNCLNLVIRNLHPASSYGFTQKSVLTKKRCATPERTLGPRHGPGSTCHQERWMQHHEARKTS